MAKPQHKSLSDLFGKWDFGRENYLFLLAGVATIFLGYIIMWLGDATSFLSVTLAPLVLLAGYLVLIPLGLLWRREEKKKS